MESGLYIFGIVFFMLLLSFISFRLGYKNGAKYVLTEWKKVNSEFEEEEQ